VFSPHASLLLLLLLLFFAAVAPAAARCDPSFAFLCSTSTTPLDRTSLIFLLLLIALPEYLAASGCRNTRFCFAPTTYLQKGFASLAGASEVFDICCSYLLLLLLLGFSCNF
jgi:hypothetical protein